MGSLSVLLVGSLFASMYCHAQTAIVSAPFVNVWVNPEEYLGPYKPPLIIGGRAVPLYTQLLYGEVLETHEMKNGFRRVSVSGQLRCSPKKQELELLTGYVRPKGFVFNDVLFKLQPLVVVSDTTVIRTSPQKQSKSLLVLPFGSIVRACSVDKKNDWQAVTLHDNSIGYVHSDDIAHIGELVAELPILRKQACTTAQRFVSMPYSLGGRSMFQKDNDMVYSSVDCSALVQLAYHAMGLLIPRISHAQYLRAQPIEPIAMQPGDCIFFKNKKKDFLLVGHVVMYLGNDMLIESTGVKGEASGVRIISSKDYFGVPLEQLSQGCEVLQADPARHSKLFFGTFLPSHNAAVDLRKKFLTLMRGE